MSKELREAAEYVLESDGQEGDGICESWTDPAFVEKAQAVARAFLASNPSDSEESVTEEWLREVGFGEVETKYCDVTLGKRINDHFILDVCDDWSTGLVHDDDYGCIPGRFPTRGQFRALCTCLGITLNTNVKEE